jgi:hypothetical protein
VFIKGGIAEPKVMPEGSGGPIAQKNKRRKAKGSKAGHNGIPDGRIEIVRITKIPHGRPAISASKPADPRGVRGGVEF